MTQWNFGTEDLSILSGIEKNKTITSKHERSLDREIRIWSDLINQIKSDYCEDVSEFTNDLSARDMIELILDSLSEDAIKQIRYIVDPLDILFINNTRLISRPLLSYDWIIPDKHFWYYRIPAKINENEISSFESQLGNRLSNMVI